MADHTPKTPGWGRRLFMKSMAVGGVVLSLPRLAYGLFVHKFPERSVDTKDWRFDQEAGTLRWQSGETSPYHLVVDGLVEEPLALSYQDLRSLPRVDQVSDFHCVEGWSVPDVAWGGFRFADLLSKVRPKPQAGFVVFHSLGKTREAPEGLDHYIESFPLQRLLDPVSEVIMALDLNDRPLDQAHGSPLRVISPYELGYKSIKYVTRVEFSDRAVDGWWTRANPIYPVEAPVPKRRLREKNKG